MADTRKDVLEQQFKDPALSLSPEELNALNYHRGNLAPGKYLPQENGGITTFYGARMSVPEGVMYYPTYWEGKILPPQDALEKARGSGIKFPVYKNDKEAAKRESVIHGIMNSDTAAFKNKMSKD
jgi:hypothetical protein